MITKEEARRIASEWHTGQASAFYSFASTGELYRSFMEYLQEFPIDVKCPELEKLFEYFALHCKGSVK